MSISELSSENLVYVESKASLQQVAMLMKYHHIGAVVVVDCNGRCTPVGMLTDRDIALSIVAENLPLSSSIADLMSKHVVKVKGCEEISSVIAQMEHEGVRRVVIVDDSGKACGIVSYDDLIQNAARELSSLGRIVERQIDYERTKRPSQGQLTF